MDTLLLDTSAWDLTVDASGNIATATGAYAIAQDVASAVRLFSGELWYDTSQGVPYLQQILGRLPSPQFMKSKFITAGLTVPKTVSIKCFLTGITQARVLSGQLQITDVSNQLSVVTMSGDRPWYVTAISPPG